jgi:hypothetical protein
MLPLLAPVLLATLAAGEPQVVRVTSLRADGPGSLRAAPEMEGSCAVVFDVGGVIELGGHGLSIDEPSVSVPGQTAPGITPVRGGLVIRTHDTRVEHLRIRPGDAGRPKRSGGEPDGITTSGGAHDVWIRRCAFTWTVDENPSASGPRTVGPDATSHRITFASCIVAEVRAGTGHAIDGQGEVGGYPEVESTHWVLDVPATAITWWLRELRGSLE